MTKFLTAVQIISLIGLFAVHTTAKEYGDSLLLTFGNPQLKQVAWAIPASALRKP